MTGPAARAGGVPLWMRVLLIVSLTINLLVLGVVIGVVASRGDGERADRLRGARDLAPPPFVLALEPRDRRALVGALYDRASVYSRDYEAVRRDLRVILSALRAEQFDAAGVTALLGAERGRSQGRQAAGEAVFIEYLEGLTVAERRAYADRLERVLRKYSRR
ncbi:periplasmic heavy metal sensor [Ovoidimarina sediminis]|uniref:periplasmic heavy metal sensor n=1 Tax=Ovoidimarina sediminis TaxID=3079856 RepID=UPI00290CD247|nr:periplasmic heavy metal sensor [Rhodophyticola sp. MJ-SS7]MDU8942126.1 periplasmic heavy metal sensor [Rhodophyticola sp. MJ-SS7]